jgi:hypothetical protein
MPPRITGWAVDDTLLAVALLADAVTPGLFVCAASIPQFDTSCEAASAKTAKLQNEASFFI